MKKLIYLLLTISGICCVARAEESEITKAMKEFKIIPDIVAGDVPELLNITYDSGVSVNMGNEITPYQAKNIPAIDWNADNNTYYTLILIDPDAPSPGNATLADLLVWLVVNIPGKEIDSGKVLAEYYATAPPRGAKLNRVIFLMYKQPSKLKFDEKPISRHTFKGRAKFPLKAFSAKYGLGEPVACNFYRTQFDWYVWIIYEQFHCCFEYNSPSNHYT